ncbi:hypothetical protein C8A00DRAFT_11578 [Chaetomidium leptoderma]|uniref:Uncharacterized protein n=1 Tax=Chaetomidium leptoderma TaxID=669021 RepID=A0AAN7A166_9PEZI|nr:hypothetical protein C8A00DRAFT_11578 [Chaetomidium leptoderma]
MSAAGLAAGPDWKLPLEDYAVNCDGWAMPIPDGFDGNKLLVLKANSAITTKGWEAAASDMAAAGVQPWRHSLSLTPEEQDEDADAGANYRYILVGFGLTGLIEEHYKAAPSLKEKIDPRVLVDATGLWDDAPTLIPDLDSRVTVMVVALAEEIPSPRPVYLYALLNPIAGLCTPFKMRREECFYLPMFRHHTTKDIQSTHRRNSHWNTLVRAKRVLPPAQQPALGANEAVHDPEELPQAHDD